MVLTSASTGGGGTLSAPDPGEEGSRGLVKGLRRETWNDGEMR